MRCWSGRRRCTTCRRNSDFPSTAAACCRLRGVETDIGFAAFLDGEDLRLRVALGGIVVGSVTPEHFIEAAENLARNFLRLRVGERRMAALVARLDATVGVAGLFEHVPIDIEAPQRVLTPIGPDKFLGAR